jgi:DNA-binding NarL/FixJ family response regulator
MVLEGISSMIQVQSDMQVVGAATCGEHAIALFREHQPDITIMDLQMPEMSGVETIRTIRAEFPEARIVVLTIFQGDEDIYRALKAGAVSYLLKGAKSAELLNLVRAVHAGERPLPPNIAAAVATRETRSLLTEREVQVMELLGQGKRNKEIAKALQISEFTIRVHVSNVLKKLEVHDRTSAIRAALQRGIIHIEPGR